MPVDPNMQCDPMRISRRCARPCPDGSPACRLPIVRETLPNGRSYDTVDLGYREADDYPAVTIPAGPCVPDGRQSRSLAPTAASSLMEGGLGGPVPWENIGGRAEFITFASMAPPRWNPLTWFGALPLRPRRHLASSRRGQMNEAPEPALVQEAAPNELRDPLVRMELKRASVWFGLAVAVALVVLLIQPLLLIFGGLVFAAMLDGGVRLLGRVLPIARGWRLLIVMVLTIVVHRRRVLMTGVQIAEQFEPAAGNPRCSRPTGWRHGPRRWASCPARRISAAWRGRRWARSGG